MRRVILFAVISIALVWITGNPALAAGSEDVAGSDAGTEETNSSSEKDSRSAQSDEHKWYIGPRIGISKFTGVLGIEAQKSHFALTAGIPWTTGVKYYFSPRGHSAFIGAFFSHWGYDDDEKDVERTEVGIGGGLRWRWRDALDLTLGVSISYLEREEEQRFFKKSEEYIIICPMLTFGYSY